MRYRALAGLAFATVAMTVFSADGQAQKSIVVALYGGEWGDAITKCISEKFAQANGVEVIPEPGVSSVTLAKLTQQKDSPQIDVAWLDGGWSEWAEERGVLAHLDDKQVPNVKDMVSEGVYKTPSGEIFALSTGYYSIGLVYNTEKVQDPPKSWKDLWDPKYAGMVTVPTADNALQFFLAMGELWGGTVDNMQPAIDKLKQLKVVSYFDSSGQASNLFESGEAAIGAHYAQPAWVMADKGLKIAYAVPSEGAPSEDIRVHGVKNPPHGQELAAAYINYAVSKEAATCMANSLYVGPATKGVALTDKAKARMPWGPEGSVKNLKLFNWVKLNPRRQEFLDLWNKGIK